MAGTLPEFRISEKPAQGYGLEEGHEVAEVFLLSVGDAQARKSPELDSGLVEGRFTSLLGVLVALPGCCFCRCFDLLRVTLQ